MATRLNAILLIPVLVGLVMGGFQVKGSIATWRDARNAEKVATIVRAASDYGQALLNERDLTAEPLLENKRDSDVVSKAYAASDAARAKFDEAVQGMPTPRASSAAWPRSARPRRPSTTCARPPTPRASRRRTRC